MSTTEPTQRPLRLFLSYAHEDKRFCQKLETHLAGLKAKGAISPWYDGEIRAGAQWSEEIKHNLETSEIILLLISPDFIASEYCYGYEMKRALERHAEQEARVIPVLIRDVDDWENQPFAKLQVVPSGAKPVDNWDNKNKAWVDVARNIRLACEEMIKARQASQAHGAKSAEESRGADEGDRGAAPVAMAADRGASAEQPGRATGAGAPPEDFYPVGVWDIKSERPVKIAMHLTFYPEGGFQGGRIIGGRGTGEPLTGSWSYNPSNRMLQLIRTLDNNTQQFMLGITIQAPRDNGFQGVGTDGHAYFITGDEARPS
jgi:hypothetical protein